MEYLTKSLKSVLGTADSTATAATGADTVERLVDRLQSSTLLDDRRDACRALKALSRTYRVEVGAQGMDPLRQVLEMDRTDCEIVGLALDTLYNITSPEIFDEEIEKDNPTTNNNIGEQFTEIFIKQQDTVGLVLSSLEDFDFRVRWPALKLLSNLIVNRGKDMQEIILIMPMGVSKLMDLLSDSREVIRNDALLLLIQLTKSNANIQKIVAFENAFDRIFDVIMQEGGAQGGIIVEDCLLLMLNLLRGNVSNQNFFKEGSYIQRLTPMFRQLPPEVDDDDDNIQHINWSPQKVANVHCMIQVLRAVVAPSCPAQIITACQQIMHKCGLLQSLCDILMVSGVPADVLTETINSVAEVIRGNATNQKFLFEVMAPSSPPRPAIVVLLMSMVNEKQPFQLRCAVLYCFQCYLYKNETGQMQLIQTLLPQSNETQSLTTGQLLCGGLFSSDPLSNWFSSVALSHALIDNSQQQKEQLLRVLLATNIGKPPVTLMQQCVMLLQQQQGNNKSQSKLGLFILLCRWTAYCPIAVKAFLNIDSSVSYLTALLSSQENNDDLYEILIQSMCAMLLGICVLFNDKKDKNNEDDNSCSSNSSGGGGGGNDGGCTKEQLCNLIEKRIGFEKFQNALGGITRNEIYSRTLKHPQPAAKSPNDLLLDHEFCRLLKTLESAILESVMKINNFTYSGGVNENNITTNESTINNSSSLMLIQYKELIREQDEQIKKLNKIIENCTQEKMELEKRNDELNIEMMNLKDQNIVLHAAQLNHNDINNIDIDKYKNIIKQLELELANSQLKINQLNNENNERKYEKMFNEKVVEYEGLKKDQDDLLELLADQDAKLIAYKEKLISLGEKVDTDESSGEIDTDDQPESSN